MLRIMVIRKKEGHEGPVFGVGQVLSPVREVVDAAGGAEPLQEEEETAGKTTEHEDASTEAAGSPREASEREAHQTPGVRGKDAGRRERVKSLKEHHTRLAASGYVPPPPKEVPFTYAGQRPRARKLTDEQVIEARREVAAVSCLQLSKRFGVSYKSLWLAIKGMTFKHLNFEHPPQA